MRETPADTAQALILAVLLHLALFAVLFIGLWWTRSATPAAAGAISAELMDASQLSSAMRRTLSRQPEPLPVEEPKPLPEPVPEPLPEPVEPQPKPQDFIPVPDRVNQEAVVEQPTPTPAKEDKVQEAKRKQEQVDLTQEQRQREAQTRETALEKQRREQLEEIRRKRAAAARDAAKLERGLDQNQQRLQQLADLRAGGAAEDATQADTRATGANGVDQGLQARYIAAIIAKVESKWRRPDTVVAGARCKVHILQGAAGMVRKVEVVSPCELDAEGRDSIERAVLLAQPLPYQGFESVYNRDLNPTFEAK